MAKMGLPQRQGSGWLLTLEHCPGCAEVEFGQACGLAEEYCVVAWAVEHFKKIKVQVETELQKKETTGEEG